MRARQRVGLTRWLRPACEPALALRLPVLARSAVRLTARRAHSSDYGTCGNRAGSSPPPGACRVLFAASSAHIRAPLNVERVPGLQEAYRKEA